MKTVITKRKNLQIFVNENGKIIKCNFCFFTSPSMEKLQLQCYTLVASEIDPSQLTDEEKEKIICLD